MKNAPTTQNKAERGVAWWAGQDFTGDTQNIVEFQTDGLDWWRSLVDLVAGPNHGLRIARISDADGELIEVFGVLPQPLKKGLRRYASWHNRDYDIQWLTQADGWGKRYELNGLGDFLNRLAERRALMQGGAK